MLPARISSSDDPPGHPPVQDNKTDRGPATKPKRPRWTDTASAADREGVRDMLPEDGDEPCGAGLVGAGFPGTVPVSHG